MVQRVTDLSGVFCACYMVLRIYSEKRPGECAYIVPDDVVGAAECYFSNVCLYLSFVKCILCSGWDDLRKNKQQFYCVCNADKYK